MEKRNITEQMELLTLLEAKLLQEPSDLDIKEKLATLCLSLQQWDRAEELLNALVHDNPSSKEALWGLARVHWKKRSFQNAYSYLSLLSALPNTQLNKEQLLLFAKVAASLAKYNDASTWLDQAIAQDSSLLISEMPLLNLIKTNLQALEKLNKVQEQIVSSGKHYLVLELAALEAASMMPFPLPVFPPSAVPASEPITRKLIEAPPLSELEGLDATKNFLLRELVIPLRNPELFERYQSLSCPKILLYGPAGCGKSTVVRSILQEYQLSMCEIKSADFLDLSYEECEERLEAVIEQALACRPCTIVIDELLWLGHVNSSSNLNDAHLYRSHFCASLLRQLLQNNTYAGLGLLAITDSPWHLDSTLFALGKIDRQFFVSPPGKLGRAKIFRRLLEARESEIIDPEKIDVMRVISAAKSLSTGAEIQAFLDKAITESLVEGILLSDDGSFTPAEITTKKLVRLAQSLDQRPNAQAWLSEAEGRLKPKSSPHHHLWKRIEDGFQYD